MIMPATCRTAEANLSGDMRVDQRAGSFMDFLGKRIEDAVLRNVLISEQSQNHLGEPYRNNIKAI